jgi:hypothetical protein
MKVYLLYLLPKKKLYAFTDNKDYLKRFLSERNSKLFKVKEKRLDKENDGDSIFMMENVSKHLNIVPLEDKNGDCSIIATNEEDHILSDVCEKMEEVCSSLKVYFTENVPFNDEYKSILDDLTTVTKNINNHPIIQIDTVKLFYYLFKETFISQDDIALMDDIDDITNEFYEKYKFS